MSQNIIDKIKSGALIVDVRTPEEYHHGHCANAVNIPVDEVEHRLAEFGDKHSTIIVYCKSGGRSAYAEALLKNHGYTAVTNAGGLSDLQKLQTD